MAIKYVLFDLDGTLSDPVKGISSCINYALASVGMHEDDEEKLKSYIGPPLNYTFKKYGFDDEMCNKLVDEYRVLYCKEGIHLTEMYNGVPEMLKRLKDFGCKICMASCKPVDSSKQIIIEHGISQYFDEVAGATLDNRILTKEQVIKSALDMLGIDDGAPAAMIGDRDMDIDGAHKHGLLAIGSAYGYGLGDELKNADFIAHCPMDIADIIINYKKVFD